DALVDRNAASEFATGLSTLAKTRCVEQIVHLRNVSHRAKGSPMTTQSIRAGWNRFFPAPKPETTLGVYRMFFDVLLIACAALISSDLLIWYGDKGVLPLAESKFTPGGQGLNLLHFLPNTDNAVKSFFGVLVVAAFCVTIGFQTRIASIIAYLTLVSFHHRN